MFIHQVIVFTKKRLIKWFEKRNEKKKIKGVFVNR